MKGYLVLLYNCLQDLAEEFKRSPFVRVSSQQDMELDDLVHAIQPGSPDSDVSLKT